MTSPTDQASPRCFGDFAIAREIGRGGMGIVYEARQISLNRKVALKVLAAELGLAAKSVERFQREAEAAAKLHHTNIVPIYATGQENGAYFYAMEFIEGTSLDRVLRQIRQERQGVPPESAAATATPAALAATTPHVEQTPVPASGSSALTSGSGYFDSVARMIADVADALDHAHKHGVIHRDIKPSNLLLCCDGRVSVNDFGLARLLEKPGVTLTGEFVGTPAYMSPEQITAGRVPLDHRTDIYSLGATLYELLTLQRPFRGEGRDQVLAQIIQKDPVPPRKIDKKVPVDLETICLKALDKDPDRRYQSARDMAEDLRRYVQRFAVLARRAGPVTRALKWMRRHPAGTLLLFSLAILIPTAGFLAYQVHVAELQRQETERQRLAEQQQSAIDKAQSAIEKAQLTTRSGDFEKAQEILTEAERLGVSAAQVKLLRGQILLHSGKTRDALKKFEEAAALQPESVAARALLAVAHMELNEWPQANHEMELAQQLQPVTSDDYLFLGKAEAMFHPEKALKLLETAVQKRPSVIARLAHAEVVMNLARDHGNAAEAEQAAREADAVKQLLPDNPVALRFAVEARTVAIWAYEAAGQKAQRDAAIALTRPDAELLQRATNYPYAIPMCFQFLRAIGEEETLLEMLQKAPPSDELLTTLYHRGDFVKARAVQGKGVTPIFVCLVLCEFPDGRVEALELYHKLAKDPAVPTWDRVTNQMVLLLLGRLEESRQECRRYLQQGIRTPLKNSEMQRALQYLSGTGTLSEEDYLKAAGESRVDQTNAHFFIGLTYLAQGKRQAALEHFEKVVLTGAFNYYHFELSWMILGRMKQDPNWPEWIGMK
jgi:tetratricopeptide (TPR) repeat protein